MKKNTVCFVWTESTFFGGNIEHKVQFKFLEDATMQAYGLVRDNPTLETQIMHISTEISIYASLSGKDQTPVIVDKFTVPTVDLDAFITIADEWASRKGMDVFSAYWYKHQLDQKHVPGTPEYDQAMEAEYNLGYECGVDDGILTQQRELKTSVLSRKVWREGKRKNNIYAWQELFCRQVAVTEKLHEQNQDTLNLVIALTGEYLPPKTNLVEMVKKSAHQMMKIAQLEEQIEDMEAVDYGVLVQLAIDTDLDATWNRANLAQRMYITEKLQELKNVL